MRKYVALMIIGVLVLCLAAPANADLLVRHESDSGNVDILGVDTAAYDDAEDEDRIAELEDRIFELEISVAALRAQVAAMDILRKLEKEPTHEKEESSLTPPGVFWGVNYQ